MLTFVCCAFNEARQLPMMLATLPAGARVVLLDGAYRDYPHEVPWSTDGTLEIAERFGCEIVRVTEPWPDQVAKRTRSLQVGGPVFIIDADELLEGIPEHHPGTVGWVRIINPLYRRPYDEPRMFDAGDGWHYDRRHHWVFDGEGRLVAAHGNPGADYEHRNTGVTLHNMRDWRDAGRHTQKVHYATVRNEEELRHAL